MGRKSPQRTGQKLTPTRRFTPPSARTGPMIPTGERVAQRCSQDLLADLADREITLGRILALAGKMQASAEEQVTHLTARVQKRGHPPPACQVGCSTCCYLEP